MADEPTHKRPERGSPKAWHVVRAALRKGAPGRPDDQRLFWATRQVAELVTRLGLPVVLSILLVVHLVLTSPTRVQMQALADAVGADARVRAEQHKADLESQGRVADVMDKTAKALDKLSDNLDSKLNAMESGLALFRGVMSERFHCPTPPACKPSLTCPEPFIKIEAAPAGSAFAPPVHRSQPPTAQPSDRSGRGP